MKLLVGSLEQTMVILYIELLFGFAPNILNKEWLLPYWCIVVQASHFEKYLILFYDYIHVAK